MRVRPSVFFAAPLLLCLVTVGFAQEGPIGVPVPPLDDGPLVIDTAEQHKSRVSVVVRGLSHPWVIAFMPGGGMLVTERDGQRIREVRQGPDELLYVLTDHVDDGALLRREPSE